MTTLMNENLALLAPIIGGAVMAATASITYYFDTHRPKRPTKQKSAVVEADPRNPVWKSSTVELTIAEVDTIRRILNPNEPASPQDHPASEERPNPRR